ncbi:expressed unknown protein [Seminavis robusta]|uniref:Uncharacterized protein n=1 Tax=Seminavis robusta TaxID=568900 RepID=A0A9N8DD03_9STRA|nr:expressed unknown protein [Seminavis robusta]|eukprot:Sro90_g047360.1 n/a (503) ;mRNA; r:52811-54319
MISPGLSASSGKPPLRSGKWTREEEEFANALIEEFKGGSLSALPEGTSMRGFLAKMLRCVPKRVSKKFENTNYNGKLQYVRDKALPSHEVSKRHMRLDRLERAFLASLSDPTDAQAQDHGLMLAARHSLLTLGGLPPHLQYPRTSAVQAIASTANRRSRASQWGDSLAADSQTNAEVQATKSSSSSSSLFDMPGSFGAAEAAAGLGSLGHTSQLHRPLLASTFMSSQQDMGSAYASPTDAARAMLDTTTGSIMGSNFPLMSARMNLQGGSSSGVSAAFQDASSTVGLFGASSSHLGGALPRSSAMLRQGSPLLGSRNAAAASLSHQQEEAKLLQRQIELEEQRLEILKKRQSNLMGGSSAHQDPPARSENRASMEPEGQFGEQRREMNRRFPSSSDRITFPSSLSQFLPTTNTAIGSNPLNLSPQMTGANGPSANLLQMERHSRLQQELLLGGGDIQGLSHQPWSATNRVRGRSMESSKREDEDEDSLEQEEQSSVKRQRLG